MPEMKTRCFPDIRPHWLRKSLFLIIVVPMFFVFLCAKLPEFIERMGCAWHGSNGERA